MFGTLREHETPLIEPLHNKVTIVVLLENNLFEKSTLYLTEEELQQCYFIATGVAQSRDRKPLVGSARVKKRKIDCNHDQLQRVLTIGRDYIQKLDDVSTFDEVLKLTYQVNTLMFSNTWTSCLDFVDTYLNITSIVAPTPSTVCTITDIESPQYLEDPCCNQGLLPFQCCLERDVMKEVSFYGDVNTNKVESDCGLQSSKCVESYLMDYGTSYKNSVKCSSFESDVSHE